MGKGLNFASFASEDFIFCVILRKRLLVFLFFISCQSQENCFIVTVVSVLCCHGVPQNPGRALM